MFPKTPSNKVRDVAHELLSCTVISTKGSHLPIVSACVWFRVLSFGFDDVAQKGRKATSSYDHILSTSTSRARCQWTHPPGLRVHLVTSSSHTFWRIFTDTKRTLGRFLTYTIPMYTSCRPCKSTKKTGHVLFTS